MMKRGHQKMVHKEIFHKKILEKRTGKQNRQNQKHAAGILVMAGVCAMLLRGCGNAIPEMTEEEESMIVTYAADLIAQYDPDHTSRLIDTNAEAARRAEIAEKAAAVQAIIDANRKLEEEEREKAEQELEDTERIDAADQTPSLGSISDMAEFLELGNLELSYAGYDISKTYGEDQTGDWSQAVDSIVADEGKNLLIVKLHVSNNSSGSETLNLIEQNVIFKIGVDGNSPEYAMTAMLMNDFSYAYEELEQGQGADYVLITQVSDTITQVSDITWNAWKDDLDITVKLQ